MNLDRLRPKPGEDLDLWLSSVVNDAMRDAIEAGMARATAVRLVLRLAQLHGYVGLSTRDVLAVLDIKCVSRLVGHPRAVCAYLADGSKIRVVREEDGSVSLLHIPQAAVYIADVDDEQAAAYAKACADGAPDPHE